MNQKLMEQGIAMLLKGMDCDLKDPNFTDTPKRVARMYTELLKIPKIRLKDFPSDYDSLVLLRNHRVFGVCPHHLLPFKMRAYLGYLPNKRVLGLSKLARLLELHRAKPVLQEEYTHAVASDLFHRTEAKGAACIIAAKHGCMQCRGVRTTGDIVTSSMQGVFLLNQAAREELLNLIGRP
jgi:GTP cyclohydrolase I